MYKLTCLHHPKSGEGDLISIDTGDKVSSDIGDKVSSEPGDKKKLHGRCYDLKQIIFIILFNYNVRYKRDTVCTKLQNPFITYVLVSLRATVNSEKLRLEDKRFLELSLRCTEADLSFSF